MGKSESKLKRLIHPLLRSRKRRGELVEAAFVAKAMGLGLSVSEPCSEEEPYDFVVFNIRRAVNRVQVKSAWVRWGSKYYAHRGGKLYKASEIDFMVVAIPKEDVWYVVPFDAIKNVKMPYFCPQIKNSKARFEKYKEAWHLLTGDEPGVWQRYQRFTIHAQADGG